MSTKDYLSQAYRIDQRINSKLAQVMCLRDLLGKATGTLSGALKAATPNPHSMEDTIAKMVDLENEINERIDVFVDFVLQIHHLGDRILHGVWIGRRRLRRARQCSSRLAQ